MEKRIKIFAALLLCVLRVAAQNTIAIGSAEMEYLSLGQSVSLPVTMNNTDPVVAVELLVKVPRGGQVNAAGCQLAAARADDHQISADCIDETNNIYKVTAFSASNKPFRGSSGQVMTLDIVTSTGWLDGRTYAITITKALLCKANGDNVCTGSTNGTVTIPNTPHADITFDATGIVTTVKKGTTGTYSLAIRNQGTATTGNVSLQLPEWMSLQGAIMPIGAGESATAVIAMTPTGEANMRYDGYIGINIENGNNQVLPYQVTIVSDEQGTVNFTVCDEYTYYDEAAPKVQNATIVVRNSSTGEVVATLNTGNAGTANTTQPEGYYEFTVTADGHETYTTNILIYPGQTTERTVNLSLGDGISIEYQVVETEEGDGYEIIADATLEVAVPAPQVTLTNRGLIKARDVTLTVPEIEGFTWEALTPIVFDLRPQETSFVTIRYTRVSDDEGCKVTWQAHYTW